MTGRQTPNLDALTLTQKAALTSGADFWHTKAVPAAGVRAITMADGPHGLRKQPDAAADPLAVGVSLPATCFPPAVGLGSSWNPMLAEQVGAAIAAEARAAGVDLVLGPGVNIKRSPLGGRNFEYVSEDPFVSGRIGAALIRGIQGGGVGACVKHFAANNQESDRLRVSAQVDERTLREIYLPAFEHCVTSARPAAVMSAYNRVNGVYASQNPWLLTTVLREEWGFDGLVVSDWGAVEDRAAAIAAGCDLAMPASSGGDALLAQLAERGEIDPAALDASVRRVTELAARTDPTGRTRAAPFDADAHHDLARRAAHEGAVLLKNTDGLLPLDPRAPGRLAVIGELARTPRFQGGGSSHVVPTRVEDALQALHDLAGDEAAITFAPGYRLAADESATRPDSAGDLLREAVEAARSADTVLLFLGLPEAAESEGADRTSLALPADQVGLVHAVAAANPRTAVILSNGSVVELGVWHDEVAAVLEGWLLGQAGGRALADLIFGLAAPSGRLTETIPLRIQDVPSYLHFPGGEGTVVYGEGLYVGYRGYDTLETEVAYPFGHGLAYTRFDYSALDLAPGPHPNTATVALTVENAGGRAGAEVVQIYVRPLAPSLHRPVHELKAFAKIALEPGESTRMTVELDERAFAHWSPAHRDWVVAEGAYEIQAGASSRDLRLRAELALTGTGRRRALTPESTVGEWLADARGAAVLAQAAGGAFDPGSIGPMGAAFPLGRIAALFGLGAQDLERLCAAAEAEA